VGLSFFKDRAREIGRVSLVESLALMALIAKKDHRYDEAHTALRDMAERASRRPVSHGVT
jgi:hypothetical protein